MEEFKDYYKILGLTKKAAAEEIKSSYRKLARKHHPDVNKGDKASEARFKEITEAYNVLSDPEKRQRYDELGSNWNQAAQDFGRARGGPHRGARSTGDYSDFFQYFFGGGFGGNFTEENLYAEPPKPVEHPLEVTLAEVYFGGEKHLSLELQEPCPNCGGSGIVRRQVCPTCTGAGMLPKRKRLTVKVPPGVHDNSRLRVSGQGPGGGDLYLRIKVLPHAVFGRKGSDLTMDLSIPVTTAALGGEVDVPTMEGNVRMKIPEGTQGGRSFRLRGRGLPVSGGSSERGDQLVKVFLTLPDKLTTEELALYQQLSDLRPNP